MGVVGNSKPIRENEDWIIRDVTAAHERGSDAPDSTRRSNAQDAEDDLQAHFGDHPMKSRTPLNPNPLLPNEPGEKPHPAAGVRDDD